MSLLTALRLQRCIFKVESKFGISMSSGLFTLEANVYAQE